MADMPAVLGIDCASRASAVFDGNEFFLETPCELSDRLGTLQGSATLICWDAPLTGPPAASRVTDIKGAYSMRPIERFFNRRRGSSELQKAGLRPPIGINTLGYSGMSHWAVTRALTGHPRVGPHDGEPRFELACGNPELGPSRETQLAEVHPALALWLWLRPKGNPADLFAYKQSSASAAQRQDRTANLARLLCAKLTDKKVDTQLIFGNHDSDWVVAKIGGDSDRLDAYVAWVLGRLWAAGTEEVMQLGDDRTGSFLLPKDPVVCDAWHSERGGGEPAPKGRARR